MCMCFSYVLFIFTSLAMLLEVVVGCEVEGLMCKCFFLFLNLHFSRYAVRSFGIKRSILVVGSGVDGPVV